MKIKLITDSTSQIPVEFAQDKNIAFIEPLIDFEGEYRGKFLRSIEKTSYLR